MKSTYDQKKIDALASELMEPQQLAGGGAIRKAAEAVRQAADNDLDMSTEARMQRAAEQGFNVDTPVYHGTGEDFLEFDPLKIGKTDEGWFGQGFYFSPIPEIANQYAAGRSPNVQQVYLRAKNPYDWRKNEGASLRLGTAEERYAKTKEILEKGYDAVDVYSDRIKIGQDEILPDNVFLAIVQRAQSLGDPVMPRAMIEQALKSGMDYHDFARRYGNDIASMMPVKKTLMEQVVFDPANIRSVNAAFDPAKRESSNILSGLGAGAVGLGALTSEDDPEGMSKGGLVDKLRSAASSVKEAGNVYKAAVGNMFSPFEPTEPQLGDPNDYEFPELRLRRPGIVNLAIGMPNMFADMRYLFGNVKDAAIGDNVPDEQWPRWDKATEALGRYEEDMDTFLRAYTGKSVDELSGPMSAVLGVSEALAQPGIISAKAVAGLPRLARYLSNITEFATPVTVASPGAMMTGAGFNAGIRVLPALTDDDELKQIYNSYLDQDLPNKTGRDLTGREQAGLNKYLQELLGKKDGGLIDRINQGFYENISKPAVGTAIDMTLGLGDLAQMAARYLGNKAGFDAGEFTSVAQPVREAIGVDDYNPYTIGGVGASILPFAAAGRTAQAINAAPAGVRQLQAALPNLGRESAAYVGAEAAGAGAREFMPDSPMAEVLASVAGGMGGSALGSQPTSMGIIKEKGGNWLAGSIEDELARLHSANQGMSGDTPAKMLAEIEERYPLETWDALPQNTREFIEQSINRFRSRAKIDDWIDTKLNKYIRNEMATESDPIRLYADSFEGIQAERLAQKDEQIARAIDNMERARLERGRTPEEMTRSQAQIRQLQRERALIAAQTGLHVNPETVGMNRYNAPDVRMRSGYPEYGSGRSYAGKAWEDSADVSIREDKAGDYLFTEKEKNEWLTPEAFSRVQNNIIEENPWLAKIPPETSVYKMRGAGATLNLNSLGFDHMMDELRNATRVDSDLPENLRIDPNNLSKMSVPQIVQKIDEINAFRDVQRIEADALKAFNAATIPHRDYETIPYTNEPNVEGLRWVQIAVPQTLPEGYRVDLGNDGYYGIVDDQGKRSTYGAETEEEAIRMFNQGRENDPLRDALKYEGDAMGHCVGGYCDEVRDGATRIFSLRDAKGRPHATVEVQDAIQGISGDILNKIEPGLWNKIIADNGYHDGGYEWLRTNRPDILEKLEARPTQRIEQIKGIRNAAPASQYMPFVQDFVRSGQWSEVGDIQNTGLTRLVPDSVLATAMREAGQTPPEYVTNEELSQLRKQYSTGYAKGGLVYDADAINALANELMEPVRLAGGGPPPRSRIAKAAAAVRGATTPPREVPDYLSPQEREFLNRDVITGQQVSERVPTGKNYVGDPYDPSLKIGVDVIRQMPEQMRKQADVMANYLNYPENAPRDPESVFRLLGDQGVENLLWLHDQMPEDVRRMSSYWYEGANKMAGEAAQRYGIPIEGTAGVYAALSPQMDWFKNVSLGNRLMDIMSTQQDQMFTPEMRRRGQELVDLPNAGFNPATAVVLDRIKDARLGDLKTPMEKAIWLRVFDEAHNPREYDIVDPMGNVMGLSLTNKGVPARVSWGGLKPIEKGISMFEDPSISNVTRKLGEMHKVRSFYNNIVDPYSGNSVTSDTHNVAAALLRPLSQSNIEVLHNMGSASSTDITGARGTYGFYADAVRRAAQERGLDTPREMQSITWEGVRGLYPPEMKRSALQKQKIDNAFNQYRRGQISGDQLRDIIGQEGGGIRLPAWYAR